MKFKKTMVLIISLLTVTGCVFFWQQGKNSEKENTVTETIKPKIEDLKIFVSTIGIVKPQNRIEVKPSISGRIESILVKEGELVKSGQILAYMSSTERAALLDSAKAMNSAELEKWSNVYKPVQIIAPMSGEIIVRAIEPGQTVNSSSVIVALLHS